MEYTLQRLFSENSKEAKIMINDLNVGKYEYRLKNGYIQEKLK